MTNSANPFCFGAWPSCHSWSAPCLAEFFRCPSSSAARPSSSSTRSPRAATPRSSSSSRGGLTRQHPPSLPPSSFLLPPPSSLLPPSLLPYLPTYPPPLQTQMLAISCHLCAVSPLPLWNHRHAIENTCSVCTSVAVCRFARLHQRGLHPV